jgi:hypothetical protein
VLETAKGAAPIANLDFGLTVEGDKFTFKHFEGAMTGKLVVVDAKAGKVDLVGAKGTLYCTFRIEDGTLTLAVWGKADDRQAAPSTDKGMVFTLVRAKKG